MPRHPHKGACAPTWRQLTPGFVLITDGETKSAGGNQSRCQPALLRRTAAASLCVGAERMCAARRMFICTEFHQAVCTLSTTPYRSCHSRPLAHSPHAHTHSLSFLCSLPSAMKAAEVLCRPVICVIMGRNVSEMCASFCKWICNPLFCLHLSLVLFCQEFIR